MQVESVEPPKPDDIKVMVSDEEASPSKSHGEGAEEGEPMLYVDVNLGNSGTQRIVVYEGDTAEALAEKFSLEYKLDENMKEKLTQLLESQIAGVLEKIDEEQVSQNSDNKDQE